MTPYRQLVQHAPSLGLWGDCYRTAIGCLLDYPPEAVPHFADNAGMVSPKETAYLVNKWLGEKLSLRTIEIPFSGDYDVQDIIDGIGKLNPGSEYLFSGNTRIGTPHVVVCRGKEQIHDPSCGDFWIVDPHDEQKEDEGRWFWATFLAVDFNSHLKDDGYAELYKA